MLRAQGYKQIKDKEVLAKRSMIAKTPNVVKRAQLAPRNLVCGTPAKLIEVDTKYVLSSFSIKLFYTVRSQKYLTRSR